MPQKLVPVFFLLEKDKNRLLEVSQVEVYVCLKCFEAIMVNICMVNYWFTVVYCLVIHSNGHLPLNGLIS